MSIPPFEKHPAMIVHQQEPLNAGPPPALLRQQCVTPTTLFYVRNHGTVPHIDPASYRLTVDGLTKQRLSFSLDDLRASFPSTTLTATLQCAGNRRSELSAIAAIPGETDWEADAISTAVWRGVPLRALLEAAGVQPAAQHVAFTGLDATPQTDGGPLGGSVPLAKALCPEVLIAYEINGAPLPPTHGYPLRVVAPGYIGARSVKWLAHIRVQAAPSDNYFQAHAYKLFPPQITKATAAWEHGLMLGELGVNAVICTPGAGAQVQAGALAVRGYALAGGGRSIERVELSADGGDTWVAAALLGQPNGWMWRFWERDVRLTPGQHTLVVRAWDCAANTQPEDARSIWNFKGYMNNAWHQINVEAS